MEYWSLEQAVLGGAAEKPLVGQVAVVTGGAGTIGFATAKALRDAGAEIALFDRAEAGPEGAGEKARWVPAPACDVTDGGGGCRGVRAHRRPLRRCRHRGLQRRRRLSGKGASARCPTRCCAKVSSSISSPTNRLRSRRSRSCGRSGTGGCLLFNVSKQAVNPGPNFGPYGLPKAATLALMRQYALEYGAQGIRANAVNADRIRRRVADPAK